MYLSLPSGSLCFSCFCLLFSSVSDFHPERRRRSRALLLGSLVQSCCGEGGMLQTNSTGICGECSQCLSHTGPAPAHGACALPAQALSKASPGLHAPPRSKPLRFRHSGSTQRRRLCWACVLCPSQLRAAQVMRCLASAVTVTYCLSHPCHSVFWVYNWHTFSGG